MEFQRLWQSAWKNDEIDASKPAEKTTTKLRINHGDCTTNYTFSNEKFAMQGAGKLLDKDGYWSELAGTVEGKYLKEAWKLSGVLRLRTPDLSGAKINGSVRKK